MTASTSWGSPSADYRGKLLIKPSKAALRRIRERLRTEMRALRGANAAAVLARLNPIIRGWAAYYRTVVSSEVFTALDSYLWRLTYKWAKHRSPEQAEALDRRPLLRPVQQVPAGPVGVRRPRQRRLPAPSSPGPGSSDTRWSRAGRPRTTPPWPSTGPTGGDGGHPRRWTGSACVCCRGKPGAAQLRGPAPARRPPAANPSRMGTVGSRHPQGDAQAEPHLPASATDRARPAAFVSYTSDAADATTAAAPAQHFCTAREPSGLA